MTPASWILVVGLGLTASAIQPMPHQTAEESLRGALDAVTRKQRSLGADAYYAADQPSRRAAQQDDAAGDSSIDFIPLEGAGQQETIGDGYQHLNNKQFNRALMDYFYASAPATPVQSVFRERERTGSQKRAGQLGNLVAVGDREPDRRAEELARLYLGNLDDEEFQRELQKAWNKYKFYYPDADNNDDDLELRLGSEYGRDESQDPSRYLIPMAERRNVNARYPLFNREYKAYWDRSKRFPIVKRSTKSPMKKRQVTDTKVAQDLGALFGTQQTTDVVNHTHDHEHDHGIHEHDQNHEHDHDHKKGDAHSEHTHGSENTKIKNLKENLATTNVKTNERPITVRKKSIDWSNYFGIDRRKKKSVYYGKPNTKDQDDEYLLQQYYELMAENLNPNKDREALSSKRDKLQQVDSRLKNMQNMMLEEAVQIGTKGDLDTQEVKDQEISRITAAYNLEKLRRALQELSDSARNEKSRSHGNNQPGHGQSPEKRMRSNAFEELTGIEDDTNSCPQIDLIERRCKATEALIGDYREVLHVPCVMYHICNTCEQDECLERFALEIEKICQDEDSENTPESKKHCMQAAMILPRYSPQISATALCLTEEGATCAAAYQSRHRHRANPYESYGHYYAKR